MNYSDKPHHSVIIPFFNEQEAAFDVVLEVCEVLSGLDKSFEVLAVEDASTDTTRAELERAALSCPQLRVLRQSRNAGQAAALLRGFAEARGKILITLDGDGQYLPTDIPHMLSLLADTDMVVGVRYKRCDSWLRRMMSRVANKVRAWMLRDGLSDSGCALKVLRREVTTAFWPIRSLYSFQAAFAVAAGFRVGEMPVEHRERRGGNSKYGLRVMLWRPFFDLCALWWLLRRRHA